MRQSRNGSSPLTVKRCLCSLLERRVCYSHYYVINPRLYILFSHTSSIIPDLPRDSSSKVLLYGYGGFNISLTPWFSAQFISWIIHGNGVAIANLRGGGEFGEDWHKNGMLLKKQNVFEDFKSAAKYLVEKNYTSHDKVAINGGLIIT